MFLSKKTRQRTSTSLKISKLEMGIDPFYVPPFPRVQRSFPRDYKGKSLKRVEKYRGRIRHSS